MIDNKITILIGTDNFAKIEGAKQAFSKYYSNIEIKSIKVSSNTNDQPINEEILQGAKNRINNLKKQNINYNVDYYIASEAGLIQIGDKWLNINLALIVDSKNYESVGTSQGFMIPNSKFEEIKQKSLGIVMDELFNGNGLSKNLGGIYNLSNGIISRIDLVRESFILALVPFIQKKEDLWK